MVFWIADAYVKPDTKYDLSDVCPSTSLSQKWFHIFGINNLLGNYLLEAHHCLHTNSLVPATGIKPRKSQESEVIPQNSISDNRHLKTSLSQLFWPERKAMSRLTGQPGSEIKVSFTHRHLLLLSNILLLQNTWAFKEKSFYLESGEV